MIRGHRRYHAHRRGPPFADYQAALQQVAYSSTNPTPFTADRVITVTVNDGDLDSNVATTYMHVAAAPVDVPPVLNLDADSSTAGAWTT
jgi:hypothetical protein